MGLKPGEGIDRKIHLTDQDCENLAGAIREGLISVGAIAVITCLMTNSPIPNPAELSATVQKLEAKSSPDEGALLPGVAVEQAA